VKRKKVQYEGGYYIDIVHCPMENASWSEIQSFDWPDPREIFDFSILPDMVNRLNRANKYWCMIEGESLFDRCWSLRGMEQFMTDLLIEPELASFIVGKMAEFFFKYTEGILKGAKGCIDAIGVYNELGTQNGMMISPHMYRQSIKPYQKQYIEMVKSYNAKIFYHSCGAVEPIYEDLIEIGVDVVDPLQLKAMNTKPEDLKRKYGDRITFHGGLDTQGFMNSAGTDEVVNEVHHLVRVLGEPGGYILSGSHHYQIDIPVSNIEAVSSSLLGND